MKAKRGLEIVASLLVALVFASGCVTQPKPSSRPPGPNVGLPRDVKNAEADPVALKESSVIVYVPSDDEIFVGQKKVPTEDLHYEIEKSLGSQTGPAPIVYIACGGLVKHGTLVKVINETRKAKINQFALLVQPPSNGDATRVLKVQIPVELDPNEDLSRLKPNPLMLVASLSRDLNVELNRRPMGTSADTTELTRTLTRVFQLRKEQAAYKPGMETRSDLTEDERVEKTITIKAARTNNYAEVVRLIDAVKGAGASPIVLQIDDLSD